MSINPLSAITEGVLVSVETSYYPAASNPIKNKFAFAYRITILNQSLHTIQLISRHWYIFDDCIKREVVGDGVIGKQPVLKPGQSYDYISGSHLTSPMGKMYGTYLMKRTADNHTFKVQIPVFQLIYPFKLN